MTQREASPPAALRAIAAKRGLRAQIAREIGVTEQAVRGWILRGRIPAERVPAVSRITGHPLHALRPDVFPAQQDSASA